MATELQKERLEVFNEALEEFKNLDKVLKIIDEQQALFLKFFYHYSDFPDPWATFHGIGEELQDAIDIVIEPRNWITDCLSLPKKYSRTFWGDYGYKSLTELSQFVTVFLNNLDPFDYRDGLSQQLIMITDAMIAINRVLDALIPKLAKADRKAAAEDLELTLKNSYYMTLSNNTEDET